MREIYVFIYSGVARMASSCVIEQCASGMKAMTNSASGGTGPSGRYT